MKKIDKAPVDGNTVDQQVDNASSENGPTINADTLTVAHSTPTPDPFAVSSLRLPNTINDDAGAKKVLAHLRVGKPDRQSFFRVNPDEGYRIVMATLELKEENEVYAVPPNIAQQLPSEIKQVKMSLCVTTQGTPFLWPVPLPSTDGRENPWHRTARMAADYAERDWVRMSANRGAGCYDIKLAMPGLPEPQWPTEDLTQLLRIAFGDGKLLDRIDHPVIKRLQGK